MNPMTILPAIDLKDGHCVRLRQGVAEDVTVYHKDPVEMARRWEADGAEYLHIVDLDGAFMGRPVHTEVIQKIARAINIPFEVGGGVRSDHDIQQLLDAGTDRVILGTRACANPEQLEGLVADFGANIAVGIDARDGRVQVKGWTETTELQADDLAKDIAARGVQTIIYTDTARDGMLQGVNLIAMERIASVVDCQVIASGGVSSAEDVELLQKLALPNLSGVIVGKALYEGSVTLRSLKAAAAAS